MLPHYGFESASKLDTLLVQEPELVQRLNREADDLKFLKSKKQKTEEAAKKHAVAEQLRRKRINYHIDTLRELLLPNMTSKTAKASVLTETIRQVKELKKRADDVALQHDGQWRCAGGGSDALGSFTFPGESDEATVSYCEGKMVKATVCCEDRPGLNRDLTAAIRSVGARPVRAEMATIGGRTKAEVVVQLRDGGGGGGDVDVGPLTRALKALVESRACLGHLSTANRHSGLGLRIQSNKRAGLYNPFYSSTEWENILLRTV